MIVLDVKVLVVEFTYNEVVVYTVAIVEFSVVAVLVVLVAEEFNCCKQTTCPEFQPCTVGSSLKSPHLPSGK